MLTCVIPFKSDPINLAVLLCQLQPQLHESDDIYIIDTSPDHLALKIATIYGTTRCYIFVEPTTYENSLKFGIQSMVENKQEALLFLSEDCFISSTFILNMKKLIKSGYEISSPVVYENPYHKMDTNFKFFNPIKNVVIKRADNFSPHCFMIVDKPPKPRRSAYGLLTNEYVLVMKNTP
jgi:hypothetical protein